MQDDHLKKDLLKAWTERPAPDLKTSYVAPKKEPKEKKEKPNNDKK